jgi:RNA polymerase sigma factor (sigma-70 family)
MQPTDDGVLLRQYVENHSDEAFAALVTRHINLVYSVAVRCVGDRHQAEEVAQAVFILLAKKAAELRHDKALSSWLFQTTRLTASNFIRGETRRHRREQEAQMQSLLNEPGSDIWPRIAPLLDDAVAGLNEKDRDAVVLRFYEGRSLREVGAVLGASEAAAEKRVSRAVERLREILIKRGVTVGTSGLVVVISANAVQAAPVGLAGALSTSAVLAGTNLTATATATIGKTIAMTTLQKVLVTATIIAVGVAMPLVIQHQAKLRKENARTGSAQRQLAAIPAIAASENEFPRGSWAFRGYATPESALVSLVWSAVNSDVEGFLNSLSPDQQARVRLRWQRQGLGSDEAQIRNSISNQFGPIIKIRILDKEILSESEVVLRLLMEGEKGGTGTVGKKAQRIGNEWKIGATL